MRGRMGQPAAPTALNLTSGTPTAQNRRTAHAQTRTTRAQFVLPTVCFPSHIATALKVLRAHPNLV